MPNNLLMHIAEAPGECTQKGYEKWIQLESISDGLTNQRAGDRSHSGAASQGKVFLQDLVVSMNVGLHSAILQKHAANGKHVKEVKIVSLATVNDGQHEYLKITLTDVMVTSYQMSQGGHEGAMGVEQVSFNFGKKTVDYTQLKNTDGSKVGGNTFSVDAKTNAVT
ncbi:MAG: type VI secretion system tube protein Hcp [Acidobacteria bacterium]|nr:type VI secretion system tube protein Hcp [Acidobacteriota bacterium]